MATERPRRASAQPNDAAVEHILGLIRVWSAGCATVEEPFSVAILLAEAMGPAFTNQDVKVFGTDADEKAIAFARNGLYSREQVGALPKDTLKAWFAEEQRGWEPNGSQGRARVTAVPILDGGSALGAVVMFEDATTAMKLAEELPALKANHGKRDRN